MHRLTAPFPRRIAGSDVPCTCGGDICGESELGPLIYRCAACKRLVPWCFGAADDQFEVCDDCWTPPPLSTCPIKETP